MDLFYIVLFDFLWFFSSVMVFKIFFDIYKTVVVVMIIKVVVSCVSRSTRSCNDICRIIGSNSSGNGFAEEWVVMSVVVRFVNSITSTDIRPLYFCCPVCVPSHRSVCGPCPSAHIR
jgi:hypothetical protein